MHIYILQRLLLAVPTFLGAVVLVFVLMRLLPGDVVAVLVPGGESAASQEHIARLREQLGLTRPLPVQFWDWFSRALRFDFGHSLWTGQPIRTEFALRYPVTISLLVVSLAVSVAIALPAGILMALKQDTWVDYLLRIFTIAGLSIPNFFLAILAIVGLVLLFHWTPPLEYRPLWEDPWLNFQRLMLPALITGYRLSAVGARLTRSSMLEVLREDYIRTARAKGLRERVVVSRHALKNALIPVVTLIGLEVITLFGGIVIVETVFTIPGMGRFLVDAIFHRDYPSVQALVFVFALFVLVVNLVVDLVYAWLDPRIRYR
ncbi:MAG: ABC transporter permease [Dehalococcoidia bacterium]|nr:ABC transporter permease [Dehalococcoidia bacterium]MDW8119563.1 ABC transporter permease [Chloroflexota bacterium]